MLSPLADVVEIVQFAGEFSALLTDPEAASF